MIKTLLVASVLLAVALAASGCCCCAPCGIDSNAWNGWLSEPVEVGELRQEHKSVPVNPEATSAQVEVSFGGGNFRLTPGAEGLLDGQFVYNVPQWAPQIDSQVQGNVQVISLHPQRPNQRGSQWNTQQVRNEWDVQLNSGVPMDLALNLGAFAGHAELGGLRLRNLTLNAGACEGQVLFSTPNPETIENLDVAVGAAKLSLSGLGNAHPRQVTFRSGAGDYELSFDGDAQGQAQVLVESGMSRVVIRV
ncbi:MAG: hypothetical protein KJ734_09775, partial [Chloroflexi bacterium]|nr:hypothetical protein [Chloroflexota bacterium]